MSEKRGSFPTGECPACGRRMKTRRDGNMQVHKPSEALQVNRRTHGGSAPRTCPGSLKPGKNIETGES